MLARIGEDRTAVVCPTIDLIDQQRLTYNGVGGSAVGGFWWSLHFSWREMPPSERKRRTSVTDPVRYLHKQTCLYSCKAFIFE